MILRICTKQHFLLSRGKERMKDYIGCRYIKHTISMIRKFNIALNLFQFIIYIAGFIMLIECIYFIGRRCIIIIRNISSWLVFFTLVHCAGNGALTSMHIKDTSTCHSLSIRKRPQETQNLCLFLWLFVILLFCKWMLSFLLLGKNGIICLERKLFWKWEIDCWDIEAGNGHCYEANVNRFVVCKQLFCWFTPREQIIKRKLTLSFLH